MAKRATDICVGRVKGSVLPKYLLFKKLNSRQNTSIWTHLIMRIHNLIQAKDLGHLCTIDPITFITCQQRARAREAWYICVGGKKFNFLNNRPLHQFSGVNLVEEYSLLLRDSLNSNSDFLNILQSINIAHTIYIQGVQKATTHF